jgi:malate dehydrogenase (quinone)
MTKTDVVLIGAGILSATLGTLLRLVEPDWSITLVERLDGVAAESSDPWHNAGTGHSALCECRFSNFVSRRDPPLRSYELSHIVSSAVVSY